MRYTLKQLQYVEAAARFQSISNSAAELKISPSSISTAIDAIEAETGEKLFRRLPAKGLELTQFGRNFVSHLRKLFDSHRAFDTAITGETEAIEGPIRLGCFTPTAPLVLPPIIKSLSRSYPDLTMQIHEGDTKEVEDLLFNKKVDLALTYREQVPIDFAFRRLFAAPPHIALPADHPLASRKVLTLEELVDEPMILLNLHRTRSYMLGLFAARGLTPRIAYSSRSSEMVRSLVASGLGYAIFNIRPLRKQTYVVGDLVRIPLSSDHQTTEFGIVHPNFASVTRVETALIRTCERLHASGVFDKLIVDSL